MLHKRIMILVALLLGIIKIGYAYNGEYTYLDGDERVYKILSEENKTVALAGPQLANFSDHAYYLEKISPKNCRT